MARVLSESQLRDFSRNGFLAHIPVIEPAEADRIRTRTEDFEETHPEEKKWAFGLKSNMLFRWLYDLSCLPGILAPIEDLLGPAILLTHTILGIKEPKKANRVGWHQDQQQVYVHPYFVICNLAITDTTEENGCLRIIPGSHKGNVLPHSNVEEDQHGLAIAGGYERQLEIKAAIDESMAVSVPLKKGEMVFFHANCIHGSEPNRSSDRRVTILTDYMPTYAFQESGRGAAQLVRGVDTFGHFDSDPVPKDDFSTEAVAAWKEAIAAYSENVYTGKDRGPIEEHVNYADQYLRRRTACTRDAWFMELREILTKAFEQSPIVRVIGSHDRGKSQAISERIRWLIERRARPESICVLSHTMQLLRMLRYRYCERDGENR